MSLINDALRKARQAAAEHEERQPDNAFRAPKAYPSRGPRRGGGVVLLVLVAAMAGLSGAALVWWMLDKGESAVAAVESPSVGTTNEPAAMSHPLSTTRSTDDPTADPRTDTARPADLPANDATTPEVKAARGQNEEAATPRDVQSATAPPRASPGTPEESSTQEQPGAGSRVFVLDADLGYASLSLGYIVARTVRPFAEINDVEVYVGTEVAGFVVEKIEPDQVTLRDARGEVVLKVR